MEEKRSLICHPAVCMVEKDYQIILLCDCRALASVIVDGVTYTDSWCGVMRTDTLVHKITVPAAALNAARSYRVHIAPLADHCNYYPKPEPTQTYDYAFTPVPADPDAPVELYVLADTHGDAVTPAKAVTCRPQNQVLILNGDIGDSADTPEMIMTMHRLASTVTKGEYPVIYARGNHDTRGHNAEHMPDYVPTRQNTTFFSFRQGPVWGVVLDAGEDKPDGCVEYGGVCDFPAFRRAQTEYLKQLAANKANEYEAEGVRYRIAVCHMPFHQSCYSFSQTTPEIYAEWVHLLNEMGIQIMLCGHDHVIDRLGPVIFDGEEKPVFPTVLCAVMEGHPERGRGYWTPGQYTGCAVTCRDGSITTEFTNHEGEIITI